MSGSMSKAMIMLDSVTKSFDENRVLKGITAGVDRGEVVRLIGPSGSAKSTVLRFINGLESYDGGEVRIDGVKVDRTAPSIVAITPALAMQPKAVLFDDPTSALDPELVRVMLQVMNSLADKGMTMLVVTHEMRFAREVADRVLFLDGGVIVEQSPARQLLSAPQRPRTQDFLRRVLKPI
jgi:ABC-type polar amino acid transport system ATPase subunit